MTMANKPFNNIKLGVFILLGLLFLILLLYMIGRNRNMFGSNFKLKARFENVQGLKAGNNVRFGGIEVGTVKKVNILNDTTMEVIMIVDQKMRSVIHKNAVVSIGTDGLVGNKVINIIAVKEPSALIEDGDILLSRKLVDTDEMLRTLYKTNNEIALIAANLKVTVDQINHSTALWDLLNDKNLPADIRQSGANIRQATQHANDMVIVLNSIVLDVKKGKGSLGVLLTDTAFAGNLNTAILKIKAVGDEADSLSQQIGKVVNGLQQDINNGKGAVNALLKDSGMVIRLNKSLDNIQKGTDGFNQSMEALKHNILHREYFKKQERKEKKEAAEK